MAHISISCPAANCEYETGSYEPATAATLLTIHANTAHPPQAAPVAVAPSQAQPSSIPRGPKLDRPRVDAAIDAETWNALIRRWDAFRFGSNIEAASAPRQLFHCATEALGDLILRSEPDISSKSLDEVKEVMKSFAVIPVTVGVT